MEQLAQLLLGLVALALVIQIIKGGPDAAWAWIRAKFGWA